MADFAILSLSDCRALAAGLRDARSYEAARRRLRPRGISWFLRSGLPVVLTLYLASLEDRLVQLAEGSFVVLARPTRAPRPSVESRCGRLLQLLDGAWEGAVAFVPAVVLLITAASVGLADGSRWIVLIAALSAMAVAGLAMFAVTARGIVSLYRQIVATSSADRREAALSQIQSFHWSVVLWHQKTLTASEELATALSRHVAGQARVLADESIPDLVLLPVASVHPTRFVDEVQKLNHVSPLSDEHEALVLSRGRDRRLCALDAAPAQPGRAIPYLIGGVAILIATLASVVDDWERQACGGDPVACAERPITYASALYWLANRLFGGDPSGLGAATFQARTLGLLVSVMSIVVLGIALRAAVVDSASVLAAAGPSVVHVYNDRMDAKERAVQSSSSGPAAPLGWRRRLGRWIAGDGQSSPAATARFNQASETLAGS